MNWDLRQKFSATIAVLLVIGAAAPLVALLAVRTTVSRTDAEALQAESALLAYNMRNLTEASASSASAYLRSGDDAEEQRVWAAHDIFQLDLGWLSARARTAEGSAMFDRIASAEQRYSSALDRMMQPARDEADRAEVFKREVTPARIELIDLLRDLAARKREQFGSAEAEAGVTSSHALLATIIVVTASMLASAALAALLRATLRGNAARTERLTGANRDLDAFAGRVAHDIRGALSPMLLGVQLLLRDEVRGGPRAILERLERTAQRAAGLVEALLAFSRAAQSAEPQAVASVRSAVDDVLDELEPEIREINAVVETDVHDLHVACPPGLLRVVVANLIGNALKFLRGQPERRLHIAACPSNGACELRFADTGPGVPIDSRERVFDPFYRAPGSKVGGAGIGLATVRRIAEAHHGSASLDASQVTGAAFRVYLPLASPRR